MFIGRCLRLKDLFGFRNVLFEIDLSYNTGIESSVPNIGLVD